MSLWTKFKDALTSKGDYGTVGYTSPKPPPPPAPKAKSNKDASNITLSEINELFGSDRWTTTLGSGPDLSDITYFTCLKILCDSVAKLSLHIRDAEKNDITGNDIWWVLNIAPNSVMSPFSFYQLMEFRRNHYGNAYAYIQHDSRGKLHQLIPLNPLNVTIYTTRDQFTARSHFYQYCDEQTGKVYNLFPEEVIHLKGGISQDGYSGMCVRETLARHMQGSKASSDFLNQLYEHGLTANAVVKYIGELNSEKKKQLIAELTKFVGSSSDRIIPIPLGMDIQPLNLKLTDSQFAELKKFSSLQIAAAFGIPPNSLNDYSKSSYANSESQNLAFYMSTLLPILTIWEQELNRKLFKRDDLIKGMRVKFNVGTILRADLKTQSEALRELVNSGIYNINEARAKLDRPPIPNGNQPLVNGSYVKLEDVGKAYQ